MEWIEIPVLALIRKLAALCFIFPKLMSHERHITPDENRLTCADLPLFSELCPRLSINARSYEVVGECSPISIGV